MGGFFAFVHPVIALGVDSKPGAQPFTASDLNSQPSWAVTLSHFEQKAKTSLTGQYLLARGLVLACQCSNFYLSTLSKWKAVRAVMIQTQTHPTKIGCFLLVFICEHLTGSSTVNPKEITWYFVVPLNPVAPSLSLTVIYYTKNRHELHL